MILKPREQVGSFVVERLLGEGGLAEVYQVRHAALGSVHALKVLNSRNPNLTERLLREGRIQALIVHAHVIRVTDLLQHDGHPALLMEYVDGEDLDAHLSRVGALPFDTALAVFAGILAGVAAAHDAGVTHRDLKPANILLAPSSKGFIAKVADFGIASVAAEEGSGTLVGSMMGTPGYAAPEQVAGHTADGRADIFALGAILYTMISGRQPFADPTTGELTLRATLDRDPVPLSNWTEHCPGHICDAVASALEKDPEKRTADCRTLAATVFAEHPALRALADRTGGAEVSLELPPSVVPASAPKRQVVSPTLLPSEETVPLPEPRVRTPPLGKRSSRATGLILLALFGLAASAGTASWLAWGPAGETRLPTPSAFVAEHGTTGSIPGLTPVVSVRTIQPEPPPVVEPIAVTEPVPEEPAPMEQLDPVEEPVALPEPIVEEAVVEEAMGALVVQPPEPEVAPEPVATAIPADLTGSWGGRMGRARATLQIESTSAGILSGMIAVDHVPGAAPHREPISGVVETDGTLQFRGGSWRFSGTATATSMTGTFRVNKSSRGQPFSFSRN